MGFAGNLRTLSLAEVFQTLNRIQATGILKLAADDGGREVVFATGEIIGVKFRTGDERQALLRRLILAGTLDAKNAAQIAAVGRESQVVQTLVSRGLVTQDDMTTAMQQQAEDELYNLATWDQGDFVFVDASPEEPEAADAVTRAGEHPLHLNLNSVLMEAARRQDEWQQLRDRIQRGDDVYGPAQGREELLKKAGLAYPGSAVAPLIDAVRTVDDIVRDSVATRLDVYGVIVDLLDKQVIVPLDHADILYHANYLHGQGDYVRAARMFRRALSERPDDAESSAKLGACLERLGDTPEAASCFAQLALVHMNGDNIEDATTCARKAVELVPTDPALRLALVRCLLAGQDAGGAVVELRVIAKRYLELGQLEDMRGTCLKIIEIDPADEESRRELARIFSSAEKDPASEDVVVCVSCGHVNHREATSCDECKADLRLTCMSCNRVVGVSDKLCIFCGADPHAGGRRRTAGSPATSRIIRRRQVGAAGSIQAWRDKLETLLESARQHEQSSDYDAALAQWREVAKIQVDNPDVLSHIRELEARSHDDFIEKSIERGHQLRRIRRYWAATKAYKGALRSMSAQDPRAERLTEILRSTSRSQQVIAVIYTAALVLIVAVAYLVARPTLMLHEFTGHARQTEGLIAALPASGPTALSSVEADLQALGEEAAALSPQPDKPSRQGLKANMELERLRGEFITTRLALAERDVKALTDVVGRGDLLGAERQIAAYRQFYGKDTLAFHLLEQEKGLFDARSAQQSREQQAREAPERLAAAEAKEAEGALAEAQAAYQALARSPVADVAAKAKEAAERLDQRSHEFSDALAAAARTEAVDLARAETVYAALAAQAESWGRGDELARARAQVGDRLKAATAAAAALGDQSGLGELDAFLREYPNVPETGRVRTRRDGLGQRLQSQDQSLKTYRDHLRAKRHEKAWQVAHGLIPIWRGQLPADLLLPLVVETSPPGMTVRLGGEIKGTTPLVLALPVNAVGDIALSGDGWVGASRPVQECLREWRWQIALAREVRWKLDLGKPAGQFAALGDGAVMASMSDGVGMIDQRGQVLWRLTLGTGDDLGDGARLRLHHLPLPLGDGRFVVGLPGKDAGIIDAQGHLMARFTTIGEVRGRPLLYVNEVFSSLPRLAFVADGIFSGELGLNPARIPLANPALAGPIAVARDLDRVLAFANLQCHLVGIEESTRKTLWSVDMHATEVGQLVPAGDGVFVAVLDGSRLVCYQVRPDKAVLRWSQPLPAAAVGDPVIAGSAAYIAAGNAIIRVGLDGVVGQPALVLPAPASAPAFATADGIVGGCTNGTVVVARSGAPVWSSPCGAAVTAVAATRDAVVVALTNGTVLGLAP